MDCIKLWSPNEIQETGADKDAVSGSGGIEGCWRKLFVGGFAASGLKVNNNYNDNQNIGVAGWWKSC